MRKVGTCGSFLRIVGEDAGQRIIQADQPLVHELAEHHARDRLRDGEDLAAIVAIHRLARLVLAEGLMGHDDAVTGDERHERFARIVGPGPADRVDLLLRARFHAGFGGRAFMQDGRRPCRPLVGRPERADLPLHSRHLQLQGKLIIVIERLG